MDLQKKTIL